MKKKILKVVGIVFLVMFAVAFLLYLFTDGEDTMMAFTDSDWDIEAFSSNIDIIDHSERVYFHDISEAIDFSNSMRSRSNKIPEPEHEIHRWDNGDYLLIVLSEEKTETVHLLLFEYEQGTGSVSNILFSGDLSLGEYLEFGHGVEQVGYDFINSKWTDALKYTSTGETIYYGIGLWPQYESLLVSGESPNFILYERNGQEYCFWYYDGPTSAMFSEEIATHLGTKFSVNDVVELFDIQFDE